MLYKTQKLILSHWQHKYQSNVTYNYVWGAELITNGSVYYIYNAHGDVIQLLDSDGNLIKTYDYDAYGNELTRDQNDSNPLRYCGEYYDVETGFIYLRARYYDPNTGRFISQDPAKDGLNWYIYCIDNPLNYLDPSGLISTNCAYATGKWFFSAEEAAYNFGAEYNKYSIDDKKEYSAVIYSKMFYEYDGMYYTAAELRKMAAHGEITLTNRFWKNCNKARLYACGEYTVGDDHSVDIVDYIVGKLGRIEGIVHTHGAPSRFHYNDEHFSDGADRCGYFGGGDKLYAEDVHDYGIKYVKTAILLNSRELAPKGRGIDGFVSFLITPSGDFKRLRPGIDIYPSDYEDDITDTIPHNRMIYPKG